MIGDRNSLTEGTISHQAFLIEEFQFSSLNFYKLIAQAVFARKMPGARVELIEWPEGGFLSARRTYLRVRRNRLAFDICGAPFGTGFFFSLWCRENQLFVDLIPVVNDVIQWYQRRTPYGVDTVVMFQQGVQNAVIEVVGEIASCNAIRSLSQNETRPILKELSSR